MAATFESRYEKDENPHLVEQLARFALEADPEPASSRRISTFGNSIGGVGHTQGAPFFGLTGDPLVRGMTTRDDYYDF